MSAARDVLYLVLAVVLGGWVLMTSRRWARAAPSRRVADLARDAERAEPVPGRTPDELATAMTRRATGDDDA